MNNEITCDITEFVYLTNSAPSVAVLARFAILHWPTLFGIKTWSLNLVLKENWLLGCFCLPHIFVRGISWHTQISELKPLLSTLQGDETGTHLRHVANARRALRCTNWIGKPLKVCPSGIARLMACWNSSFPAEIPVLCSNSYAASAGVRI